MRLINIHTYELKEFFDTETPPYGILSHTWDGDEITYKEYRKGLNNTSRGHKKIIDFCHWLREWQARRKITWESLPDTDESVVEWAWVDTCCIDKRSTAELSEAINSMFSWYNKATICVAYLSDVFNLDETAFKNSRWFTRGFTLQELLAPTALIFCSARWLSIGHRCDQSDCTVKSLEYGADRHLNTLISTVTDVDVEHLGTHDVRRQLPRISIARRMSWAARRKTTRPEDITYCLLGLFQVHMPLLYGEGHNAFIRLQHELIKNSQDQSIFTNNFGSDLPQAPILAQSPADFLHSRGYVFPQRLHTADAQYDIRQRILHMKTQLFRARNVFLRGGRHIYIIPLNCHEPVNGTRGFAVCELALTCHEVEFGGRRPHEVQAEDRWRKPLFKVDVQSLLSDKRRLRAMIPLDERDDLGVQDLRIYTDHVRDGDMFSKDQLWYFSIWQRAVAKAAGEKS